MPGRTAADPWTIVDSEKRRDRALRRACVVAWIVVVAFVLVLAIAVGISAVPLLRAVMSGQLPWITVVGTLMPLIIVLWILSVLVATLCTIGVFLRLRTASLIEIQLRLSALESMITRAESDHAG
jgi:uncharacterized membrane protein YcjF (UPF0283 family)